MRIIGTLLTTMLLFPAGLPPEGWAALVNPGFETTDAQGGIEGWTVLTGLDPAGYGEPDFAKRFDAVAPTRGDGGQGGSARCLAFPARGTWFCPVSGHSRGNGVPGNDGKGLGKAAAYQTVSPAPGRYRFGVWLRTADGAGWTAAFRLGWSVGRQPEYAHDGSTRIHWSPEPLAYKRDRLGTPEERGEWSWHATDVFEVMVGTPVTVWIRFDYVNENQFPARWQADNAAVVPERAAGEQHPGSIVGIVKDLRDQPVPGAVITLTDGGWSVASAGNGVFALHEVPAGRQQLRAVKEGWEAAIIEPERIEVRPGAGTRVEVVMRPREERRHWRDVTDLYLTNTTFDQSSGGSLEFAAYNWVYAEGAGWPDCGVDHSVGRHGPSLRITGAGRAVTVFQDSAGTVEGRRSGRYRLEVWSWCSPGMGRECASVRLSALSEDGAVLASTVASAEAKAGWQRIETPELRLAPDANSRIRIELRGPPEGTMWFDDVRLESAGER